MLLGLINCYGVIDPKKNRHRNKIAVVSAWQWDRNDMIKIFKTNQFEMTISNYKLVGIFVICFVNITNNSQNQNKKLNNDF